MEECGHGRWLEGDSYKLDYFLGKNQEKKRERGKKKKTTKQNKTKQNKTLTLPFLAGRKKRVQRKERISRQEAE